MNTYGVPGRSGLRRRGPTKGRGQGHPRTTWDPLGLATSHPRATKDGQGQPKSRQEGPRGRHEGSKRAPGGARRPPGPPKNNEKRCTVDEIRLFGRTRLSSRPEGPKSRAKSASGAAQERPGPREAQEQPKAAKSGPGALLGAARDRPRNDPGGSKACKIGLKRLPEGSRRPQ